MTMAPSCVLALQHFSHKDNFITCNYKCLGQKMIGLYNFISPTGRWLQRAYKGRLSSVSFCNRYSVVNSQKQDELF
jgi:hypothetical protein